MGPQTVGQPTLGVNLRGGLDVAQAATTPPIPPIPSTRSTRYLPARMSPALTPAAKFEPPFITRWPPLLFIVREVRDRRCHWVRSYYSNHRRRGNNRHRTRKPLTRSNRNHQARSNYQQCRPRRNRILPPHCCSLQDSRLLNRRPSPPHHLRRYRFLLPLRQPPDSRCPGRRSRGNHRRNLHYKLRFRPIPLRNYFHTLRNSRCRSEGRYKRTHIRSAPEGIRTRLTRRLRRRDTRSHKNRSCSGPIGSNSGRRKSHRTVHWAIDKCKSRRDKTSR